MTGRAWQWLARQHELRLRWSWAELLAIVAAVIIINVFWPGTPGWVFITGGFAAGWTVAAAPDLKRWYQRRRTA